MDLRELKKLKLPSDKYAVFGSGGICIRGLKPVFDIDLIVKSDLWEKLSKK